ncbi:ABC transporter ATP-binding protein [Rhizobium calliandrae]|uniref:ABC transporter ATP-binding protein n=1 Tax=Rhizobium calliandrae TaxID=1312182 RepID=A0ABT7KPH2_9HYPH|nr:ABC transporter ATP-binding protein [Rhizobium calliandrae]MDL2410534.1 ABC transporter ATP-binding protein [Rhizobium calliandrae]
MVDHPRLLKVNKAAKSFGAVRVLEDVTFTVDRREAVGILGPNGAGKSTLFNLIAGELPLASGSIHFDGVDLGRSPPDVRVKAGIARSYQIPRPFEHMTVFENVLVGATFGSGRSGDQSTACNDILHRTGLYRFAGLAAGSLTLLNRKRLELARAMATEPQLILLDEIAGGLTPAECDELVGLIREIHAAGTTVIWVEHIVNALVRVVDRLIVLAQGTLIADGPPAVVLNDPRVRTEYMGGPSKDVP